MNTLPKIFKSFASVTGLGAPGRGEERREKRRNFEGRGSRNFQRVYVSPKRHNFGRESAPRKKRTDILETLTVFRRGCPFLVVAIVSIILVFASSFHSVCSSFYFLTGRKSLGGLFATVAKARNTKKKCRGLKLSRRNLFAIPTWVLVGTRLVRNRKQKKVRSN